MSVIRLAENVNYLLHLLSAETQSWAMQHLCAPQERPLVRGRRDGRGRRLAFHICTVQQPGTMYTNHGRHLL